VVLNNNGDFIVAKLGELYRKLTDTDITVLEYMVSNLKSYEYIPIEIIIKKFKKIWSQKEIMARIKKLNELGFIERHLTIEAYRLRALGLDCVAISRLVKNNIIKALGDVIGTGKESVIFNGLAFNDNVVAIKFYRIGRRSFRHIAKVRRYGMNLEGNLWLIRSIVAGEREGSALTILNKYNIAGIPKIYGYALHTVVIEFINGTNLYKINELDNPLEVFNQVVDIIKNAYKFAGIIHGDLSEYNIMIQYDEVIKTYIIDWPQYVLANDPQALETLKRDIIHLTKFFNRKFKINMHPNEILENILS
jgi:RIO kinase 2